MSRLSTIYALFTIHYHLVIIICVVDNLFIIIYIYSILESYILSILLPLFTTPMIIHIFPIVDSLPSLIRRSTALPS